MFLQLGLVLWETRQFGTKTFRYRWKKVSNRHRNFFQTNVITFLKWNQRKLKKNINDRLNAIKT